MSPFFKDSWNQLFLLTLGTSAIFLLSQVDVDTPSRSTSSATQSTAQAPRQPQAIPPQNPSGSQVKTMQAKQPIIHGDGFIKTLKPHKLGEWVVDIKKGEGSDSASIDEVMFNASENDIIIVRPGVYQEKIIFTKSVHIIGQDRDSVIIENLAETKSIFHIEGLNVTLSNLTLRYTGTRGGFCGICVRRSEVFISNINFSVDRYSGIQHLIDMADIKSAKIEKLNITNVDSAIRVVDSMDADIRILNSNFSELKNGVTLDAAKATLQGLKFSRISRDAVIVRDGDVNIDDMKVTDSQSGIYASNTRFSFANIEMERLSKNGIFLGQPRFGERKFEMKNITIRHTYKPWSIMDRQNYVFSVSFICKWAKFQGIKLASRLRSS